MTVGGSNLTRGCLVLIAASVLAACGTSDSSPEGTANGTTGESPGASAAAGDQATDSGPVTVVVDAEVVFDGPLAVNALHLTGPDDVTVAAAVAGASGQIVDRAAVAEDTVYVVVFEVADLADLDAIRAGLDAQSGITASLIPRLTID